MCVPLSGCNALKFTYERAPMLTFWWLDSYLDLEDRQAPQVRSALREWFRWHRHHALPRYRDLLRTLQRALAAAATPAAVCALNATLQEQLASDYAAAVPPLAALAITLAPAQLAHLKRQFAKRQADLTEEYLDGTAAARDAHLTSELRDAFETLYGRLTRVQRDRLAALVAHTPFDSARWLAERRARQADILAGLRALLVANAAGPDTRHTHATRWLHELGADFVDSPRRDYRIHHAAVLAANCALVAEMHNLTTEAQRARAVRKIQAWDQALAALIEDPTP